MKQNIYDNPDFFNGYMELRSNERGFNKAIEEPAVYSLLPSLKGLRILDLGCGFGKFVSFCLQKEAAFVLGTDISYNMISEAKKHTIDPRVSFKVIAAEDFMADEASFDLVVSSMCFHYVRNIKPIFEKVALSLRENGQFIFSVEHPICTSLLKGWCSSDGIPKRYWPIDDYKKETIRISRWFVDGVIKYHRTIETYINELIDAGFSIKRLLEPGPTQNAIAERPALLEHLRRPPVLVLAAIKKSRQKDSANAKKTRR
jgi:SAM-dependent methyltransferase